MRFFVKVTALAALLCLALPVGFAASRNGSGTIVIVFKDGHRQSFNLSEIERVEFPSAAASETGSANALLPSRGRFLGKWEVGDGSGSNFFITLEGNGDAWRSKENMHGKWAYENGEARITWDDGWHDAIRRVGPNFQKFAYSAGKSFTDTADNIANARNTTPHPI